HLAIPCHTFLPFPEFPLHPSKPCRDLSFHCMLF
ncbi:hypothetical protein PANDA_021768, partial [Ailuropoda melanoleuca]